MQTEIKVVTCCLVTKQLGVFMDNIILQSGLKLINKYYDINKRPRSYGTDVRLYPSEIHVIDVIGSGKNMTTTKIAAQLGITKGGVSQTTSKLCEKGLITRSAGSGINEVTLSLTPKGKEAFNGHLKLHKHMNKRLNDLIKDLDYSAKESILEVLNVIDEELSLLETQNDI